MNTNLQFPKHNCPRCDSDNTNFCYYTLSLPRYFCKDCRRYWTEGGGTLHKSTSTSNKRPVDLSVFTSGEKRLKIAFENMHQGYPTETMMWLRNALERNISGAHRLVRNALERNIYEAHRLLVDSLNWSIQNDMDEISSQPIIPAMDVYSMITINFNNTNMLSPTSFSSSPTSPATPLSRYESQKRRDWNLFREYLRNHRLQAKARGGQPVIAVGGGLSTYDKAYVPTVESIDRTLRNFNSGKEPVLLQFWESTPSNSEDMGCNLMLTDQTFMSAPDEGLEEYRRRCLESRCRFVGLETSVGNWLAGRAAQTGLADHRTMHHVLIHKDQHSLDIGNRGQLVLPVYHGNKLVGIFELVTSIRKESYVDYLEQIQQLLKDEGLKSGYMGKTIKVEYDSDLIRFTLPLLADITDLHREVKKRFPELEHQTFRVEYDDAGGNRLPISSGEDLRACIAESSLKGGRFIKMCVLLHA